LFRSLPALLALPTLLWADGPSDLRAGLQRLQDPLPVQASLNQTCWQETTTTFRKPVTRQGLVQLHLHEDGSGLHVDWPTPVLDASNREKPLQEPGPATLAPDSNDLSAPDAATLRSLLNQADLLARTLAGSRFQEERRETYQGRPARVLVFVFQPRIRPEHQGRVSQWSSTLKVWIGEDGLPLASESAMTYEGRHSRLYGPFHSRSQVKTTYAVQGHRLVVTSRDAEDLVYDGGEKVKRRQSISLVVTG
jgi:hypothetical protein